MFTMLALPYPHYYKIELTFYRYENTLGLLNDIDPEKKYI